MCSSVRERILILSITSALPLLFLLVLPSLVSAASGAECISCHEDKGSTVARDGSKVAVPSAGTDLRKSVHRDVGCLECHRDASPLPHKKGLSTVDCVHCHSEAGHQFGRSVHGVALSRGDKDAPSCATCHGSGHRIYGVSDPRSTMFRANLVKECIRCHTDAQVEKKHKLPSPDIIKAYEKSVHGRLLKEGKPVQAAVCTDCHGAHLILGPQAAESKINRANIPEMCGRCHGQIYNEYKVSIHGRALKEGRLESPGCTDCHGEHTLTVVNDPKAPVYQANVSATCSGCHENQRIIRKYGLPSGRYSSYVGSFHGVSVKYGNLLAASCTSCHEVHRILPASEAESSISPQNVPRTCGKCHPGMRGAASIGKVHVEAKKESSLGMYYVRRFYMWFIGGLMFLFLCYIVLDVYGAMRRRRRDG
jgi:predicted CXXCH cytochrome family protein